MSRYEEGALPKAEVELRLLNQKAMSKEPDMLVRSHCHRQSQKVDMILSGTYGSKSLPGSHSQVALKNKNLGSLAPNGSRPLALKDSDAISSQGSVNALSVNLSDRNISSYHHLRQLEK